MADKEFQAASGSGKPDNPKEIPLPTTGKKDYPPSKYSDISSEEGASRDKPGNKKSSDQSKKIHDLSLKKSKRKRSSSSSSSSSK